MDALRRYLEAAEEGPLSSFLLRERECMFVSPLGTYETLISDHYGKLLSWRARAPSLRLSRGPPCFSVPLCAFAPSVSAPPRNRGANQWARRTAHKDPLSLPTSCSSFSPTPHPTDSRSASYPHARLPSPPYSYSATTALILLPVQYTPKNTINMQFNVVSVVLAALVATAAAHGNETHGNATNGTAKPTPAAPDSAAFQNAVSGGLLGAAIAGGIALVL